MKNDWRFIKMPIHMKINSQHAMRIQYLFHKKQVTIFIEELVKPGYQKNEE